MPKKTLPCISAATVLTAARPVMIVSSRKGFTSLSSSSSLRSIGQSSRCTDVTPQEANRSEAIAPPRPNVAHPNARNFLRIFALTLCDGSPKYICDNDTSPYQAAHRAAPWRHRSGSSSHSRRRGHNLQYGHCCHFADSCPAYEPWMTALKSHLAAV